MAIYISGIDMPKEDEMLFLNVYPDGKVTVNLDLKCMPIATAFQLPPLNIAVARGNCKSTITELKRLYPSSREGVK